MELNNLKSLEKAYTSHKDNDIDIFFSMLKKIYSNQTMSREVFRFLKENLYNKSFVLTKEWRGLFGVSINGEFQTVITLKEHKENYFSLYYTQNNGPIYEYAKEYNSLKKLGSQNFFSFFLEK